MLILSASKSLHQLNGCLSHSMTQATTAPPLRLLSAVSAGTEETEYSIAFNDAVTDNDPVIKVRKNKIILGEPTLTFQCNGQDYIRLSDPMLEQDLHTIHDPEYRGFFDALGEKVTYVIAVSTLIDTSNIFSCL